MEHLGTHVLDTMNGRPAAGLAVKLQRIDGDKVETLRPFEFNADGRNECGALLNAQTMAAGRDRRVFPVAGFCRGMGVMLPEPPFIEDVRLDLGNADAAGHHHVPLLVSPWACSSYRGS